MSSTPVRCPHCHAASIAEARPSRTGSRLRVVDDLAYGQPKGRRNVVQVICPECGKVVEIPGRLMIVQDAA